MTAPHRRRVLPKCRYFAKVKTMRAGAPRCWEGNSRSRRPTITFKSCRSLPIMTVCGVRNSSKFLSHRAMGSVLRQWWKQSLVEMWATVFPIRWRMWVFYFLVLAATPPPDRAEAYARAEETRKSTGIASNRWRCVMTSLTAHRAVAASLLFITPVCLTSCATISHHQFSEPAAGWQTKTGQLMYRTAKTTLIGEAIVRFSKRGRF